jgi:hypothetical protein
MYISISVLDVILITSYLPRSKSYGKEETSEVLHLEYIVWCWNLNTTNSRSEKPGKFWNVVLKRIEKIGLTDHLRNEDVVQSQRGKEDPRNNK